MKLQHFEKDSAGNLLVGLHERFQNRFTTVIGIDPDTKASGFAVYVKRERKLTECTCLAFFELLQRLEYYRAYSSEPIGIIEGGWLVGKSNWHDLKYWEDLESSTAAVSALLKQPGNARAKDAMERLTTLVSSKTIAARESIARRVGENHATGKLIVEMFIHVGIPFRVVPPRKPIFEKEPYFKKITGWKERTNKDARSAANYCFGY